MVPTPETLPWGPHQSVRPRAPNHVKTALTSDESHKQPSITDDNSSNSDTVEVLIGEIHTNNLDAVAFSEFEKCSDNTCEGAFSVAETCDSDLSQRSTSKTLKFCVKRGRSKKSFLFEHCGAEVIHLPWHLRLTHQCSKEHARTAIQRFSLRPLSH